jgi:uncharacterized membrane protein
MKQEKFGEKDFQSIVGNLLRYGVWTSLSVAAIGGVIYLMHHGNDTVNYAEFIENDRNIFTVISNVLSGSLEGNGASIIFLGIVLLFLTPVVRVILSLFSFLLEKDYLYTVITMIVVAIIVTSITLGFSH